MQWRRVSIKLFQSSAHAPSYGRYGLYAEHWTKRFMNGAEANPSNDFVGGAPIESDAYNHHHLHAVTSSL